MTPVAVALDDLFEAHRLVHLTLSPRTVALVSGRARLMDFGLAELFWLPCGQQPGTLNTRYAAPELFDGQISRHADQYSLALIFQEMLTGVHAFRNLNARQMASTRQRGKPDLGMMPATDRVLLLRALHADPERRFDSCSEFIEALVAATVRPKAPASSGRLAAAKMPKIVGPSRLRDGSPAQAVNELSAGGGGTRSPRNREHAFLADARCVDSPPRCACLIPSVVPIKLAGFREQWKGT